LFQRVLVRRVGRELIHMT